MTQGWAVLFCLLTELASAMSLYNSVMHLYFKIFCHSGLAKTSLSQICLLLQLWEPHRSISVLPATLTALLTLPRQGKAQGGLRRKVSCEDWSETTEFIAEVYALFHLVTITPGRTAGLQNQQYIAEDFVEESRLQAILF